MNLHVPASAARNRAIVAALAATMAGCAHSPPTSFYALDARGPEPGAPAPAYAGPPVWVSAVRLPAVMDRPQLIARLGDGRVRVNDFAQWAAPVGELARAAFTQDLAARLPSGEVIYAPGPRPKGARELSVAVLDFEIVGGEAIMDASWTETDEAARPTGRTLRLSAPAPDSAGDGPGPGTTARALSGLLARLADRVAADQHPAP